MRELDDNSGQWVELSRKVKEASPDLTIHRMKNDRGVKSIIRRGFDVSPSFLTKVLGIGRYSVESGFENHGNSARMNQYCWKGWYRSYQDFT